MKAETKKVVVAVAIVVLSFVGIILVSNIARQNHDALVRQQVIETCKEFK